MSELMVGSLDLHGYLDLTLPFDSKDGGRRCIIDLVSLKIHSASKSILNWFSEGGYE